jgi:aldehyde:ferredoxin oxidoreductase
MKMNGWRGKILRVNLTDGKIDIEDLDPKIAKDFIGGRGLGSKYLFDEVDPKIDPLSPDNKLIFATGPVTGTAAIAGARYMVVTKSPLTGAIASSNSSGYFGPELKFAGYDMIIFEGRSKEPVYLWIEDEKVELRSAVNLWGKNTDTTQDIICGETHKKAKVACIGPAGEKLVKYACIINDEGRAAGRSGVGAVMGSKNLKAVAVRGKGKVPVADKKGLKEVTSTTLKKLPETLLGKWGTAYAVNSTSEAGMLPTRNFQTGIFEGSDKINADAIAETVFVRRSPCYHCPIGCGRITKIDDPAFKGEGAGPEYEGLYSFGSCCGVDNLAAVIKAHFVCNELGFDIITAGATIACAMEMFDKGILSEETIGMKLNFGNAEAIVKLVEKIGNRDGFGDELAEGSYRFAEKYGHPEFSMSVKKQELPGYDPRGAQGMGLAFATSNRGACHLRGETVLSELWGLTEYRDRFEVKGKAQYLVELQNRTSAFDAMGICLFLSSYRIGEEEVLAELETVTGAGYDLDSLNKAGERIWNLERLFNIGAGLTIADDNLPKRFLEEPMPEGPSKGHVNKLGEMLPEYYQLRGWDKLGKPTENKLSELGIMIS